MTSITDKTILDWDKRYRTNFVNALSGFRSVNLVGTLDAEGKDNLAIFNSAIHVGANPPLMGILLRPEAAHQHTRANIFSTNYFTLSAVTRDMYEAAHQTSARYAPETSEFDACGFTRAYFDGLPAPAVAESPIRIALERAEHIDIALNGTTLVVGRILHIEIADALIQADGHLRLDQADLIGCAGLDTYYHPRFLAELPYAKPPA